MTDYGRIYRDLLMLEELVDTLIARVNAAYECEDNPVVRGELFVLWENLRDASDWLQDSRSYFGMIVED